MDATELVQGLRAGRLGQGRQELLELRCRAIRRWAESNVPLPWDSTTTRLYLFSQRERWTPDTAAEVARAVAILHGRSGWPDPVDGQVRALLARWDRLGCSRGQPVPVDALGRAEVQRIVEHYATEPVPGIVLMRRAWALVCAWSGADMTATRFAEIGEMTSDVLAAVRAGAVEVTLPGKAEPRRWIDHPEAFSCLTEACDLTDPAEAPNEMDRRAYRVTACKLGHRAALMDDGASLAGLDSEELFWLLAALDGQLYSRRRNLAYLVVGVGLALRHDTMRNIDAAHLTLLGEDGYEIFLKSVKGLPAGRSVFLPHLREDPSLLCGPLCPACALSALVDVSEQVYGRRDGPVFASLYGGRWRRWTRQGARYHLKTVAEVVGLDLSRVSTRSLRAGGATQAFRDGMALQEIADRLTFHVSLDELLRYIRMHDAEQGQLILDL